MHGTRMVAFRIPTPEFSFEQKNTLDAVEIATNTLSGQGGGG